MISIITVLIAKQSHLQELSLPLLQPLKTDGAAGQCRAQEPQGSQQALAITAGQMPMCLRTPEGCPIACLLPWTPRWVPQVSVLHAGPCIRSTEGWMLMAV